MYDIAFDFQTLDAMRLAHAELLKNRRIDEEDPIFLNQVKRFVAHGKKIGRYIHTNKERQGAQALIDFWDNVLQKENESPPDATLDPFDPTLAIPLADEDCPYLGLYAFEDNKYFFGRERLVNSLVQHLQESRLLAVVGPSGSGKSSVVMAGLRPSLQEGVIEGSEDWHYLPPFVPGSNPLISLAQTLWVPYHHNHAAWVEQQAEQFLHTPRHLTDLVNRQFQRPTLLIIDQFEELFTLKDESRPEIRQAFIANLIHFINSSQHRHTLILTMRVDYMTRISQFTIFQSLFEENIVSIVPLNAGELREAIETPAKLVGLKFEDGIVTELLQDILGEPAALPLLQFTLLKLWEMRERNWVTYAAYRKLGGGRQALANSADQFYQSLLPEEQATMRRILLRLVRPEQGLEFTSSRVRVTDLYQVEAQDRVERVLQKLEDAHLIRLISRNSPDDVQAEIAHEALVRNWPRLVSWLEDERERMRFHIRIRSAAQEWENLGRDETALWRGALLEEALSIFEELSDQEQEFITRSYEAEQAAKQAEEEAHRQEIRRLRRTTLLSLWAAAIISAITIWAFINRQTAQRNAIIANQNAERAITSEARAVDNAYTAATSEAEARQNAYAAATSEAEARQNAQAAATSEAEANLSAYAAATSEAIAVTSEAQAQQNANALATSEAGAIFTANLAQARLLANFALNNLSSELGWLLALEAVNVNRQEGQPIAAEAENALYEALQASQLQYTLSEHIEGINDIEFSPDGRFIATASDDKTALLWDRETGRALASYTVDQAPVTHVRFSPDGAWLATAGQSSTFYVQKINSAERPLDFTRQQTIPTALDFNRAGNLLAVAYDDQKVYIWDLQADSNPEEIVDSFAIDTPIHDLIFASEQQRLFIATAGRITILNWQNETLSVLQTLEHINLADRETPLAVNSIATSQDGSILVSGTAEGTLHVWTNERRTKRLVAHAKAIISIAFSPDDQLVATASEDGVVHVWDTSTWQVKYTITDHSGRVSAVAFSPDGRLLATAGQDKSGKIWDAYPQFNNTTQLLFETLDTLNTITYSADGSWVMVAKDDDKAVVWNSATGQRVQTFTHIAAVKDAAFNAAGLIATASENQAVRIWSIDDSLTPLNFLPHPNDTVRQLDFHPNGRWLLTGTAQGVIHLWEIATNPAKIFQYQLTEDAPQAISNLRFNHTGSHFAVTQNQGSIQLWSTETLTITSEITFEADLVINDLAFAPDDTLLATAANDGNIYIWDIGTDSPVLFKRLTGHEGAVTAVVFHPTEARLASGSTDRTVKIWDYVESQTVRTLRNYTVSISDIDFNPEGTQLAVAAADGTAQLVPYINIKTLFEIGRSHAPRPLTPEECDQYLRGQPCLPVTDNS